MAQASFKYMANPEPKCVSSYRYMHGLLTEYSLAYKRYAALYDASTFNSPVGITKIAAGLSDLMELFGVYKRHSFEVSDNKIPMTHSHGIRYEKNGEWNDRIKKDVSIHDELNVSGQTMNLSLRDAIAVETHGIAMMILPDIYAGKDRNGMWLKEDIMMDNTMVNSFTIYQSVFLQGNTIRMNLRQEVIAYFDRIGMDIYRDIPVSPKTNNMEIENKMIPVLDTDNLNILENIITWKDLRYSMNLYQWKNLSYPDNISDIPIEIHSKLPDKIGDIDYFKFRFDRELYDMNILADMLIVFQDSPEMEILKDILMSVGEIIANINQRIDIPANEKQAISDKVYALAKDTYGNIFSGFQFHKDGPQAEINAIFNMQQHGKTIMDTNSTLFGFKEGPVGNVFDILLGAKNRLSAGIAETLLGEKQGISSMINESCSGISDGKEAWMTPWASGYHKGEEINENIFYGLKLEGKESYLLDLDTFAVHEEKYTITLDGTHAAQNWKTVFTTQNSVRLSYKRVSDVIIDEIDFALLKKKNIYAPQQIHISSDKANDIQIENAAPAKRGKRKTHDSPDIFIIRSGLKAIVFRQNIHFNNLARDVMFGIQPDFAKVKARPIFTDKDSIPVWRVIKDISINNKEDIFSNRAIYSANRQDEYQWLHRKPYDIGIFKDEWTSRIAKDLESFPEAVWMHKLQRLISVYDQSEMVLRPVRNICLNDMVIPISKVNVTGAVDRVDEMVKRVAYDVWSPIPNGIWASVIKRPVQLDFGSVMIDKKIFQVFLDRENEWLLKDRLKVFIKDTCMFVDKEKKEVNEFRNTWVARGSKDIYILPNETVYRLPKEVSVFKDEWTSKASLKDIYIEGYDEWIKKIPHTIYYSYGLFADKYRKPTAEEYEQVFGDVVKKVRIDSYISSVIREADIKIWFEEAYFSYRKCKDIDILPQLEWLENIRRKVGLHPNDFGNWVWVYETPDPIEPVFGIDELLLPENDTQYENFEDLIFDKETLMPKDPIKVIDDRTFIAKLPIRHPSKDYYKDLAINYEDSAYKLDNYYGIKTEVMHACFLKYYRIWEKMMFEFSTMTMQQSVNAMLEYMYAWMIDYFPLEELEMAFRVLRLIRWYGESAIIQNSQYLISYEYGILESKLTDGICHIPNDLHEVTGDGKTNDTMFIDGPSGVIKNNPAYIGSGPAYVEFYIANKKNTTFIFSLSNTVGSVNIYINGDLVDTRSTSGLNLTYPLRANGDVNTVRIEKPANHNLNASFFIGNIKVPDASFKNLSIEFDPNMRAGNKPLDIVAKKMVQFAQLHENRDEVYDMLFKANLGVNEVYRKLLEYWQLHHEGKVKGKRLTIKKS